jgi:hypothetical protein
VSDLTWSRLEALIEKGQPLDVLDATRDLDDRQRRDLSAALQDFVKRWLRSPRLRSG